MAISLVTNDSQVFINVWLHQFCTLQDTVMRSTHFFVIMDDKQFSPICALPSQPTLVTRIGLTNPFLYF